MQTDCNGKRACKLRNSVFIKSKVQGNYVTFIIRNDTWKTTHFLKLKGWAFGFYLTTHRMTCKIIKQTCKLQGLFRVKVFVDYFQGDLFTSGESDGINCHYIVINRMTLVGPTRYCNSFYMKNSWFMCQVLSARITEVSVHA